MSSLNTELEQIEINLLLEGIYQHYGYDFRQYAPASLKRRIWNFVQAEQLNTISGLQERVLHDVACMDRLAQALTVNVSSLFRNPGFFLALRCAVPLLRTYPFVRIWCAGCSTGEEVYSLAILLEEEGIYDRCLLYATDINEAAMRQAKNGIFPLAAMREYTANYQRAGGTRTFSDYYTAAYDHALLHPSLRRNVVFARHNLVGDASFNEFQLILCRNVMIYFKQALQERVHSLIYNSLCLMGLLGLGDKESLHFSPHQYDYKPIDSSAKLYQRIR